MKPPLEARSLLQFLRVANARVAALAKATGVGRRRAVLRILRHGFTGIPDGPLRAYLLKDLEIQRVDRLDENTVSIALKNGRSFAGDRTHHNEHLLYDLLKEHLPSVIDADSYELALHIQMRYFGVTLPDYCRNGGTFIEGGCYTGMKAIRWHDLCEKPARILAVEIGRRNFELLRENVERNGLSGSIIPLHAGLWSESGRGVQKFAYATRRFLQATDQWIPDMRYDEEVQTLTLDDLLEQYDIGVADYVNLQVNGAEIQVLQGLRRNLDRIKVLDIAAYYSQNGRRNIDGVRALLRDLGCTILRESAAGRITAVTPKYRGEIVPQSRTRRREAAKLPELS